MNHSAFNWISLTLNKRGDEGGEYNLSKSGNSESTKDAEGSSTGHACYEVIEAQLRVISAELVMSVHECPEATPTGSRNTGWNRSNQWPNKPVNTLVRYHNNIQLPSYSEQNIPPDGQNMTNPNVNFISFTSLLSTTKMDCYSTHKQLTWLNRGKAVADLFLVKLLVTPRFQDHYTVYLQPLKRHIKQ